MTRSQLWRRTLPGLLSSAVLTLAVVAVPVSTAWTQELRIAVENRPGTVAEIALELGRARVNIEDMALYPAPDMRTGAISIWVAGADEAARAAEVVRGLGHSISMVAGGG